MKTAALIIAMALAFGFMVAAAVYDTHPCTYHDRGMGCPLDPQ